MHHFGLQPAIMITSSSSSFREEERDQLRNLPIRFLFGYSLGAYLGRLSDPQLRLQLSQQSFEPACMPAGLHANTLSGVCIH
jgi:hypothetical protein